MAYEAPVLLTSAGKPYVVMTRAAEADLEDLAVGSNRAFRAIMERSGARCRAWHASSSLARLSTIRVQVVQSD